MVIGGIQGHLTMVADLLAIVSKKATGKVSELASTIGSQYIEESTTKIKFQPTKAEPFQLSKPKIKALPQPIVIPKILKANPIPENIFKVTIKEIEEDKKKRLEELKQQTKKAYEESKVQRFDFESEKRPLNIDRLKKEADDKFKNEIKKNKFYKPVPAFDPTIETKLNAAAILKEEAMIKKAKKEEEDYIKNIEMNMRDSSEFEKWKKENDEKEKLESLEHKERSR